MADERMRLLAEAGAEYDGPVGVQYFDTTFSVDKTISLVPAAGRRRAHPGADYRGVVRRGGPVKPATPSGVGWQLT
jgi:hypothetical protein